MSSAHNEAADEIRGLLIPLAGEQLLMPNALVAEVVNYQPPRPTEGAPAWLKGSIGWRGEILPVVSMEALMQLPEATLGHRARIVVLNALTGNARLPYLGLIAQAIPRLVRITPDNLEPVDEDGFQVPGSMAGVRIAGEAASIPDLDALERALLEQLPD
jgi:chemosensory pili system protein ChpC